MSPLLLLWVTFVSFDAADPRADMGGPGSRKIAQRGRAAATCSVLAGSSTGRDRYAREDHQKIIVTRTGPVPRPATEGCDMVNVRKTSLMVGLGLATLVVAAPAPAYVVEAVTAISAAEGEDRTRLDGAIQAAIDDVATHAVAFTPTVVALLDAKLIGDRIFLFVLLADREGEQAIKVLLEERRDR
jgi:hypothetical protein